MTLQKPHASGSRPGRARGGPTVIGSRGLSAADDSGTHPATSQRQASICRHAVEGVMEAGSVTEGGTHSPTSLSPPRSRPASTVAEVRSGMR